MHQASPGRYECCWPTLALNLDYDQDLAAAIEAGCYQEVDRQISPDKFPSERSGKAASKIILAHFSNWVEVDYVLTELNARGLRPAELPELLALGATYPDIQCSFPVVALGSLCDTTFSYRNAAYLFHNSGNRTLRLIESGGAWPPFYRFAALPK